MTIFKYCVVNLSTQVTAQQCSKTFFVRKETAILIHCLNLMRSCVSGNMAAATNEFKYGALRKDAAILNSSVAAAVLPETQDLIRNGNLLSTRN